MLTGKGRVAFAADVDRPDLRGSQLAHLAGIIAHPHHVAVVQHDQSAVAGVLDVELGVGRFGFHRGSEGSHRVLRCHRRGAAVRGDRYRRFEV